MRDELKATIADLATGVGIPMFAPGALLNTVNSIPAIKRDMLGEGIRSGRHKLEHLISSELKIPLHIDRVPNAFAMLPAGRGKASITINPLSSNGTLAHELGHVLQHEAIKKKLGLKGIKLNTALYGAGQKLGELLGGTALLTSLFNVDDDTVRNIGLAGSASMLPRIGEEIAASIRGAAKLKKLGLKGKLSAFYGVPSYLIEAAMPMMPWLARKARPELYKLFGLEAPKMTSFAQSIVDNYKKYKESK